MNEIKEHKVRIYMGETEDEEETAGLKVNGYFTIEPVAGMQ